MHRWSWAALAAVSLVACASSKPAPEKEVEAPGAAVTAETLSLEERDQTLSGLVAVATIKLANPGAQPVQATRARYEVVQAGKVLEQGETPLSATVPAGGEATVEVAGRFVYAKSDAEVAALTQRKEPLDYALRGLIDVGGAEVEFARGASIRPPRLPRLTVSSVDATTSKSTGIVFAVSVDLENPNTFPLTMQATRWKLTVAGKPAGEGELERKAPKPASHTTYPLEVTLAPKEVKERKELQGASVPWSLEVELDLGAAKVRLEETGEAKLLRAGD